jgi:hypothetical protein
LAEVELMIYLLWLVAGAVLLYFWLTGHWFARVVALFPLAVVLGAMGYAAGEHLQPIAALAAPDGVVVAQAPKDPCTQTNLPPGVVARAWNPDTRICEDLDSTDAFLTGKLPAPGWTPVPPPAQPKSTTFAVIGCLAGAIAAWFVAGIPVYVRRRKGGVA